ncbi:uncharacterized protein BDV14DRAFT_171103 [Aspergillus stella-maris]|uniref:uncharacterized protein n=1 Tax=Aspergillus stella-maris TaxID=1810926 RepID=UPI003CCD8E83
MVEYSADAVSVDPITLVNPILLSIAAYNVFELLFWIFGTFQRRQGLYFGSILVSTIALIGYIVAVFLRIFRPDGGTMGGYIWAISYSTLLTAQILVLYSRLYIVLPHNPRVLRAVLVMIIVTSVCTVPVQLAIQLSLAAGQTHLGHAQFLTERVVFTMAVAREVIICFIYIIQAYRNLQPIILAKGSTGKQALIYLILVQGAVVVLDIGFIAQIYLNLGSTVTGYGAVLYSLKLKMEFGVLNVLVTLLRSPVVLVHSSAGEQSMLENSILGPCYRP